ncbi:CASP-like protein 2A1 [Magnolia sinica]|uniref:CASP-like protein 2A1 n=1 Tax=Magnolia sinica TaxID=86752 RepID=UPI00265B61AC|nr:CASP-like protein 2A1 [Magnolia sinica]
MMAMMMEKKEKASSSPRTEEVVLGVSLEDDNSSSSIRNVETLLRVVPMGLCLAALILMIKNSISNDYGSVSYSNLGGFKYLVYANGLCALYSLLSAFYMALPRPPTLSRAWTLFFFDQVVTYLILAAGAVSTELLYLAKKGDDAITWSQVCGVFGGFCHKATVSVGITFGVVACYAALSLISSYRLFSSYDAPLSFPRKGIEVAAFPG